MHNIDAIMTNTIRIGYDTGCYNFKYRPSSAITDFEKKSIDLFLEKCCNVPRILDLGCGAAITYDRYITKMGGKITGIDISPNQIKLAKRNCPEGIFFCGNICDINSFYSYDGVVMFYSLFHIYREKHFELFSRIYEKSSKDLIVLLNIYNKDSGDYKYKKDFCGAPMYWSNYSKSDFIKLLSTIGFKCEEIGDEKDFGSSESHTWMILYK